MRQLLVILTITFSISLLPIAEGSEEIQTTSRIGLENTILLDIQQDEEFDWNPVTSFDLSYSPNGTFISVNNGIYVDVIDSTSGELVKQFGAPGPRGYSILSQFSPDGKDLLIGRGSGETNIHNVTTGASSSTGLYMDGLASMAFSPNSEDIVLGGMNGNIIIKMKYGPNSVNQVKNYNSETSPWKIDEVHYSNDGTKLVAITNGSLEIIDVESWKLSHTLSIDNVSLKTCKMAKISSVIYCSGFDNNGGIDIITYNIDNNSVLNHQYFEYNSVWKMTITPEGDKLAMSIRCEIGTNCILILDAESLIEIQKIIVTDYIPEMRMDIEYSPKCIQGVSPCVSNGELATVSFRTLSFWSLDSDLDGWSDVSENRCGSDVTSNQSFPFDDDYDSICDDIDDYDNRLLWETSFLVKEEPVEQNSNDDKKYSFWSIQNFKRGAELCFFGTCIGLVIFAIGASMAGQSPYIAVDSVSGVLSLEEPADAGIFLGMVGVAVFIFSIWAWIMETVTFDFDSIWWKMCCGISIILVILVGIGLASE